MMVRLNHRAARALISAAGLSGRPPARAEPSSAVTPTSLRADLELLHYEILDARDGGALPVLGEYRNVSAAAIVAPVLRLALTDGAGAPRELDVLFPATSRLAPGQSGGFSGSVRLARGAWAHEHLTVCHTDLLGPSDPTADLEVRSVVEVAKTDALLHVTGEIVNRGSVAIDGVGVRAIITRTHDGRFAGLGSAMVDAPIPARAAAAFSLTVRRAGMPGLGPSEAYAYRLEPTRKSALGFQCG